jgi:2-polyprenyl-3-methyl-5-hydroxy-6-metoxy-1,4-benzoquinol methylase
MTSYSENIKAILDEIEIINPRSVLDVGCGFGKYAILIREALLSKRAEAGDLQPKDDLRIDCVEIAQYFINLPYLRGLYTGHYWKDARTLHPNIWKEYDVVLLIDILEHWPKNDGKHLIDSIKENSLNTKVIVSTPRHVKMYTEEFYGEDCPKHVSQWDAKDFVGISFEAKNISTPKSFIYVI